MTSVAWTLRPATAASSRNDQLSCSSYDSLSFLEWQGRGIGSAVVQMLVERAHEHGSALALDVFKSNPRAAQLYESLGFVRTGESETDVFVRLEPKL